MTWQDVKNFNWVFLLFWSFYFLALGTGFWWLVLK